MSPRLLWALAALSAGLGVAVAVRGHPPDVAAYPHLRILGWGDSWGEVEPCGCHLSPTGGLDRRAAVVAQARAQGPVLLVSAGDELFGRDRDVTPGDLGRAQLEIDALAGACDGWAVGDRDLSRGVDFLKARAKAAGVPLLSANLTDPSGALLFAPHRLVRVGDVQVGLFAVTQLESQVPGVLARPETEAAAQAVAALRALGAQVVVALLHQTATHAEALALAVSGIDVALVAHEGGVGRLTPAPPLYRAGLKGRDLVQIELDLGAGPVQDAAMNEDALNEVKILDNNLLILQTRGKTASTPEAVQAVATQRAVFEKRRQDAVDRAHAPVVGRKARMKVVALDAEVGSDAAWKAKLDAEIARDGHSPAR